MKTHVPDFFQISFAAANPTNLKIQINSFLWFLELPAGEKSKKNQGQVFSEDTSINKRLRPAAASKKKLQPFYRNIAGKRAFLLP